MFRKQLLRITLAFLALIAATGSSVVGVWPGSMDPAAAASPWIDTNDRDAVLAAYNAEFANGDPASGWTGNRSSCSAGSTNQSFRNAVFSRVNFFRAMAGVPADVTENATYSAKAQEAAVMMSASGKLSHSPDSSYSCRTNNAVEASGASDLYLGRSGPAAITGYIEDPGAGNAKVGHRNWILHPTTRQMGTGDVPNTGGWASNSLWVFDNVFGTQPTLRESQGFVAWPARGFVPGELVFPRWSFSVRGGDFSNASVSMSQGGTSIPVSIAHRDKATNGAPFPVMVWEPSNVNRNPGIDTTYRVTINGAKLNGRTTTFSYDVTILGSTPNPASSSAGYEDLVNQAFVDFIGRQPTATELSQWTAALNSGMSRFQFVNSLADSDAWTAAVVNRLYTDTLGRGPDAAGRAYWVKKLQNNVPVAQVAASFYGSNEYVRLQGGTHQRWLADLYDVLLNRNADASGLGYWAKQSELRGTEMVAYQFYQSTESREARVTALYQQFLGRNPDASGLAHWAKALRSGDDLQLAAFLASSDEYFHRSSK